MKTLPVPFCREACQTDSEITPEIIRLAGMSEQAGIIDTDLFTKYDVKRREACQTEEDKSLLQSRSVPRLQNLLPFDLQV